MLVSDVTIEVRDITLARKGQVDSTYWADVKLALDLNGPGEWSMSLPADDPVVVALATPGAGIVVSGPGGTLYSGPVESFAREQTPVDSAGMIAFQGVSDSALLWDVLILPNPAQELDAQTSDYDVRTGKTETLLHQLVNLNLGPGAIASQRGTLAGLLTMGTNSARGATRTSRARFDTLGDQLATLAKLDNLGFRIVQVDNHLEFQTFAGVDRTGEVRFDLENDTLARIAYEVAAAPITDVAVAGQGEGAARTIIIRNSVASLASATAWGRRRKIFKDQRYTDVLAELQQAGDEILADDGTAVARTQLIPTDAVGELQYGVDWSVGDLIAVVVNDSEVESFVTGALIAISQSGVLVGARIG